MANEFLVNRIVKAEFTVLASTGGQTLSGGAYVPAGAIVTGVTYIQTSGTQGSAQTADSATLHLGIGAITVNSTAVMSNLGGTAGVPIPATTALLTAGGVYISANDTIYNGQVMMTVGVSNNNSNRTYTPSVYVGYVK
jgi:hypothetical protein